MNHSNYKLSYIGASFTDIQETYLNFNAPGFSSDARLELFVSFISDSVLTEEMFSSCDKVDACSWFFLFSFLNDILLFGLSEDVFSSDDTIRSDSWGSSLYNKVLSFDGTLVSLFSWPPSSSSSSSSPSSPSSLFSAFPLLRMHSLTILYYLISIVL